MADSKWLANYDHKQQTLKHRNTETFQLSSTTSLNKGIKATLSELLGQGQGQGQKCDQGLKRS